MVSEGEGEGDASRSTREAEQSAWEARYSCLVVRCRKAAGEAGGEARGGREVAERSGDAVVGGRWWTMADASEGDAVEEDITSYGFEGKSGKAEFGVRRCEMEMEMCWMTIQRLGSSRARASERMAWWGFRSTLHRQTGTGPGPGAHESGYRVLLYVQNELT